VNLELSRSGNGVRNGFEKGGPFHKSPPWPADPQWAPSITPKNVADDMRRGYAGMGQLRAFPYSFNFRETDPTITVDYSEKPLFWRCSGPWLQGKVPSAPIATLPNRRAR
jgi:hypothetical protein